MSTPYPPQLLGKSLTIAWTINRQQKFEGTSEIEHRSIGKSLSIYISSAGRAFSKEQTITAAAPRGYRDGGRGGGFLRSDEQAPGDRENSEGGNRAVHFEGNELLVDNLLLAGVRRISVSFDAGFGNCSARVVFARESGAAVIRQKDGAGRTFEVISVQTSTPSCSITSGNVFGGH